MAVDSLEASSAVAGSTDASPGFAVSYAFVTTGLSRAVLQRRNILQALKVAIAAALKSRRRALLQWLTPDVMVIVRVRRLSAATTRSPRPTSGRTLENRQYRLVGGS
jgi:hypothetical protein